MKIIDQKAEILDWSGLDLYQRVEIAARVCRQSESRGNPAEFVRSLIKRGHYSPLEFARICTSPLDTENVRRIREMAENGRTSAAIWAGRLQKHYPALVEDLHFLPEDSGNIQVDNSWIPVLITTSRTISHQLVRYRHDICFMQESQRFCRYDDGIEVIAPPGLGTERSDTFRSAVRYAEESYRILMSNGATAQQARAVLPGCTATRIIVYASPDEWRHIFRQRCSRHADPQMQELMFPLREQIKQLIQIFEHDDE